MADRLAALAAGLKAQALAEGFALAGVASAAGSPRLQLRSAALERWLAAGHAAGLGWMHDPRRRQVEALLPGAASLLLVALDYSRPERQQPQAPASPATAGDATTTASSTAGCGGWVAGCSSIGPTAAGGCASMRRP